ncbi:MAG: WbqC family protein [Muribaculaceae bacterium]|nr:WbqC family protein [Muribaculaceae bacterium]
MIFPLRLFPTAGYYAAMNRCSEVAFAVDTRYNKADKDTHRFTIADTRGRLSLTVPVHRPSGARLWSDILVSDHGRWWETMPIALESAYGRTPYFEFYIDRLMPLFSPEPVPVSELCLNADAIVRRMLNITPRIVLPAEASDITIYTPGSIDLPPYWQVRAHELGFIPGLSVLDLIFNLGPEAQIYLHRLSTPTVDKCSITAEQVNKK